jgi:hypothetical protein
MTKKMKYFKITIFFLVFLVCFFVAQKTWAATEFISIIDPGNGPGTDYTNLRTWETAIQNDLTTTTATMVYSYGVASGTIPDNTVVVGATSGAVATAEHVTATTSLNGSAQILLNGTSSYRFISGEKVSILIGTPNANYVYLSNSGDSVIAVAKCRSTGGLPESVGSASMVSISGWTSTSTNYIKIWTDPDEPFRHTGKWDDTKYRYVYTTTGSTEYAFAIWEEYVRVEGLQLELNSSGSGNRIFFINALVDGDIYIGNNIIKHTNTGTDDDAMIDSSLTGSPNIYVYNNLIYDFNTANSDCIYGSGSNGTWYVYNNTLNNCYTSYRKNLATYYVKNNIAQNCISRCYYQQGGAFHASSGNNLTDGTLSDIAVGIQSDSGNADGIGASTYTLKDTGQNFISTVKQGMIVKNTTDTTYTYVNSLVASNTMLTLNDDIMDDGENFTIYTNFFGFPLFEDKTNNDFHLDSADTLAKENGTTTVSAIGFTGDADSETRRGYWDIGADENVAKIFRSLASLATTAIVTASTSNSINHLTIKGTSTIAYFERPLPDNIGVGDAIQYDYDNNGSIDSLAFIHKRLSNQNFKVYKYDGKAATTTSAADTDWAIFRAYSSLLNAEAGTENTGLASAVQQFDADWSASGGKDITATTSNAQWIIACYANGTASDTAQTIVDGWTTSAENYLKIYTPYLQSEVGTSQRHNGNWDENKYRLAGSISGAYDGLFNIQDNFVVIDGLQIKLTDMKNDMQWALQFTGATDPTEVTASNNIIRGVYSPAWQGESGIMVYNTGSGVANIYNNLVYDFAPTWSTAVCITTYDSETTSYIYNNTTIDCYNGIQNSYGFDVAKNNLAHGTTASLVGGFENTSGNNVVESYAYLDVYSGVLADSGTANGIGASTYVLKDAGQNFLTTVKPGMIVLYRSGPAGAYVESVDSNTQLTVSDDNFEDGYFYEIYTNRIVWEPKFKNEINDDFHLAPNDNEVRNWGWNLFYDLNLPIHDDIDADTSCRAGYENTPIACTPTRPYAVADWDIGADEVITQIFRSVGPGATTAIASGSLATLTIASSSATSTATFGSAVPDNVGVGDAIQYDRDNNGSIDSLAFINYRFSSTVFGVTKYNGMPATSTTAADSDWAIYRAYTSLSNAESGTENSNISSIVQQFDGNWSTSGGKNLASSSEQWNIACYAGSIANGSTSPDTSAITINSWTTTPTNYIKIYTPYLASEAGASQRQNGKWDDTKYYLRVTTGSTALTISDNNVILEGLQIYKNVDLGGVAISIINIGYYNSFSINNNIIRANPETGVASNGIEINDIQ